MPEMVECFKNIGEAKEEHHIGEAKEEHQPWTSLSDGIAWEQYAETPQCNGVYNTIDWLKTNEQETNEQESRLQAIT